VLWAIDNKVWELVEQARAEADGMEKALENDAFFMGDVHKRRAAARAEAQAAAQSAAQAKPN
jgi:hypothetical protein